MVNSTYISKDETTTCDKKRGRPGEAPELTCRRCRDPVPVSDVQRKSYKWQEAVDAHAREECSPPRCTWMHRPDAPALAAPESNGLVFVARGCVDKVLCAKAVLEAKSFSENSWTLIDPHEDGEAMSDNRRQSVVSHSRSLRNTVAIRNAGKLVVDELTEALYGGHLRSDEELVLQFGNKPQRRHKDWMYDQKGAWQNGSATWFLGLAEMRDLYLPGFGSITLGQGDVAVLFANTWHAGMAEHADADGSEVLFGYFDRTTKFSNADAKFEVGPLLDALPNEYEVKIIACNKFSGLRRALRREVKIK